MSRERRLQEQAAQAEQDRLITNQAATAERSLIGQIRNRVAMRDAWLTATFSGARNGRTPLAVAGGNSPVSSSVPGPTASAPTASSASASPPANNTNRPASPEDFLKRMFGQRRQNSGLFSMFAQRQFGNWIRR